MTGRAPLPIGAHGRLQVVELTPPGTKRSEVVWEARGRIRDADGRTRRVKRQGRTKAAAENNLRSALSERRRAATDELGPDSRVAEAGARWLAQLAASAEAGDVAPGTYDRYESAWRVHVEPAVGELRLREMTVSRAEAWKVAMRKNNGAGITRTARTVLSGVLGYAARLDAIAGNPMRDVSRVQSGPRRQVRALTPEERRVWLLAMEGSERAMRWDVPDLTRLMLATGARIGEALAVSWDEVDLREATVAIRYRLVRVKGQGLQRRPGAKSLAGNRVVAVPSWCVEMLTRRRDHELAKYAVFPDSEGGWRWPGNVGNVLREERASVPGFEWVTSHIFRKTTMTVLDEQKLSAREIADVAGHADPSMTQRNYLARGIASKASAAALEDMLTG